MHLVFLEGSERPSIQQLWQWSTFEWLLFLAEEYRKLLNDTCESVCQGETGNIQLLRKNGGQSHTLCQVRWRGRQDERTQETVTHLHSTTYFTLSFHRLYIREICKKYLRLGAVSMVTGGVSWLEEMALVRRIISSREKSSEVCNRWNRIEAGKKQQQSKSNKNKKNDGNACLTHNSQQRQVSLICCQLIEGGGEEDRGGNYSVAWQILLLPTNYTVVKYISK